MENYDFLNFHKRLLKSLYLWPENEENKATIKEKIQRFYFLILLLPGSVPLLIDNIAIMGEDDVDIAMIIQSVLANICVIGEHYMAICFLKNRKSIIRLVGRIKDFRKFATYDEMVETDKKAILFAKALLAYSTIGAFIYVSMPLLSIKECEANKTKSMIQYGIPCGMVARLRLPIRYDYSPLYQIMYIHQVFLVFSITWVIIMLTMLLCGVVMHATHHLKKLRILLLEVGEAHPHEMEDKINYCIRYHIEIIQYCEELNASFSSQMFMHISLTSFIISILSFELLMVEAKDFIRFALHLLGWLFLLLIVSYYGQTLIDESTGVALDAYETKWYYGSIKLQKNIRMIITRAQKPITLNALNFGILSLSTFLRVMSSAYSYFTLLINIKK